VRCDPFAETGSERGDEVGEVCWGGGLLRGSKLLAVTRAIIDESDIVRRVSNLVSGKVSAGSGRGRYMPDRHT
jgi:hypothetical protein